MDIGFDNSSPRQAPQPQAQSPSLLGAALGALGALALVIVVAIFFVMWIWNIVAGKPSYDDLQGTRGWCIANGMTWHQTGSDPVHDGYCDLP